MKQVLVHGPNDLRVDDIAPPAPGADDVVVKVAACGICGSDLTYARLGGVAGPAPAPMPLGHELAGTIIHVGANVKGWETGERVIVNPYMTGIGNGGPEGGFTPELLVKHVATIPGLLLRIPDELTFERAALTEPLAVALHAVHRGEPQPGQRVVVFGAGPIGLGAVIGLRHMGVTDIVAVDYSPFRLERARQFGASATINPAESDLFAELSKLHGTSEIFGMPCVGTDLFIDAAGAPAIVPDVIKICRQGARLVVVAVHSGPVPIDFRLVLMKELTIAASIGYPTELPEVISMLAALGPDIDKYVSHFLPFSNFLEAFQIARDPAVAAKIMITFPH